MGIMHGVPHDAPLLSEQQLKQYSRNIRELVPDGAGSINITHIEDNFEIVVHSSIIPGQRPTYQVAAWNTLCAMLERCSQYDGEHVRSAMIEKGWWSRVFDVFLTRAQFARPKSAKQLLTTLTTVAHRVGADGSLDDARFMACQSLIGPLVKADDYGLAKTCALALAHFLGKDVIPIDFVIQHYHKLCSPDNEGCAMSDRTCFERFLIDLFSWMGRADFGSIVGHLVSNLLDKADGTSLLHETTAEQSRAPLWSGPLKRATSEHSIDVATLRVHLLPTLFKRNVDDYQRFLQSIGLQAVLNASGGASDLDNQGHIDLLCASLQAGKALDMLHETEGGELRLADGALYVPVRRIARLLRSASSTARLTGMTILIVSRVATRPFLPAALSAIARNLSHFFADTDANFRSDVFGLVQRLVDRIRAITAVLARQGSDDGADAHSSLTKHFDFLHWLLRFLQWQIRPTASYQRHISALKCLMIMARSGLDNTVTPDGLSKSALGETKWPLHMRILTADLRRLLLDRVVDPFDDVRQTASSLLMMFPSGNDDSVSDIKMALGRAEDAMLASGRADQADGVAHLHRLLYTQERGDDRILADLVTKLEQMIHVAQIDLGQAVARYPLHGLLTSLRYIIERNQQVLAERYGYFQRLVSCLLGIWEVVKSTLCDDAPEGYLPEDAGELDAVSTKDTLSYCWRALKESSMLLSSLLPRAESRQAHTLTELCFTQLAELRHRGAFSTVAQTWVACCLTTHDFPTSGGPPSLQHWYDKVVEILQTRTTINTRRSAGLPSLICGILIADRESRLFERVFSDFETIAREPVASNATQEGSLSQVHAINCLKDVLKNSRLGEASERYIPLAMTLAADALHSPSWAVRNCGLMLFRAVIDRLLGTNEGHSEDDMSGMKVLSAEQHPKLLAVVLELLTSSPADQQAQDATTVRSEGVFPALQLLQRMAVPADRSSTALQAVKVLLADPSWHVRDKAARTYASLVGKDGISEQLGIMLHTSTTSQNALHGALLCGKYLYLKLSAHRRSTQQQTSLLSVGTDLSTAISCTNELYHANTCPVTRTAYIDLLTGIVKDKGEYKPKDSVPTGSYSTINLRWAVSELRMLVGRDGSSAMLRLALIRLLACEVLLAADVSSDLEQRIRQLLLDVSKTDAEAVVAFFLELNAELNSGHQPTYCFCHTIPAVCELFTNDVSVATSLRCEALQTLLHLAGSLRAFHDTSSTTTRTCAPVGTNQRYMDLHLEWEAIRFEHIASKDGLADTRLIRELQEWMTCCAIASMGASLYSVEAAAKAIARLDHLYHILLSEHVFDRDMLGLCMAVYDLLIDDDEDIRTLASTTASRILADGGNARPEAGMVPAVANQRLLAFMVRRWPTDHDFVHEVLRRSFGDLEVSAEARLQKATTSDSALFAEEKQNLYVDDAQETKAWSQALLSLPASVPARSTVNQLSRWTTQGLIELATRSKANDCGPLDASSLPEVFTLGLQVIHGANYLLSLSSSGIRLPVRPSSLRRQLGVLLHLHLSNGSHPLWCKEIEQVLADSVMHKLRDVHAVLQDVEVGAGLSDCASRG